MTSPADLNAPALAAAMVAMAESTSGPFSLLSPSAREAAAIEAKACITTYLSALTAAHSTHGDGWCFDMEKAKKLRGDKIAWLYPAIGHGPRRSGLPQTVSMEGPTWGAREAIAFYVLPSPPTPTPQKEAGE